MTTPQVEFELWLWIKETWNASLINGGFLGNVSKPSRLRLIFEEQKDVISLPKFWKERQDAIGNRFENVLKEFRITKYDGFSSFKPEIDYFVFSEIYLLECIKRVDTQPVHSEFCEIGIHSISRFFTELTVFYHKDEDVLKYEAMGVNERIADRIQQLVKELDEFGNHRKDVRVRFDSREHFERAGIYYYR
ncbi:MAG: hypothetical protein ACOYXT_05560 [Bacteroidota bacterium]